MTTAPDPATDRSPADDLAVALALAAEADLISLDRYRAADLDVSLKADRTHVTDADRRVESALREHLERMRPGDAILGEEFGSDGVDPASGRTWIIDPIDGTANFLRGVPNWGTLIALAVDGVPRVGVVSSPAVGRRWWGAHGLGAFAQEHGGEPRRIRVSEVATLEEASVSYQGFQYWDEVDRLPQLTALNRAVWRTRAIGDVAAYMLLAEGALDAVIEFGLKPWDVAALWPIVREAGGRITTVAGADDIHEGSVLATNGRLHAAIGEIVA